LAFEDYYLISGYRQLGKHRAQKICEVLSIENGKPKLGKAVFNEDTKTPEGRGKKRIVLNYSPVAKANINVNADDKIIVFDNIITVPGRNPEEGMLQVPDGSYQAYEYNAEGKWIYNEKLYTEFQETPLNGRKTSSNSKSKKDLFGRPK